MKLEVCMGIYVTRSGKTVHFAHRLLLMLQKSAHTRNKVN